VLIRFPAELQAELHRILDCTRNRAVDPGRITMTKTSAKTHPRLIDSLRYFSAFMLYMYGISKLLHLQFNLQTQLAGQAVGSLNGYQLTWFYFGFSRAYAVILGLTQVSGATLLLFRKTTLLGALAMLPVMANILLINMFILVNDYGPYLVSGLIFASLLIILLDQRAVLISTLWTSQEREGSGSLNAHRWIRFMIVLAAITIMVSGAVIQRHVQRVRQQDAHHPAADSRN
jgi:hypothetical protein